VYIVNFNSKKNTVEIAYNYEYVSYYIIDGTEQYLNFYVSSW